MVTWHSRARLCCPFARKPHTYSQGSCQRHDVHRAVGVVDWAACGLALVCPPTRYARFCVGQFPVRYSPVGPMPLLELGARIN